MELLDILEEIRNTLMRPCIKLEVTPMKDGKLPKSFWSKIFGTSHVPQENEENPLKLFESKFGGVPYIPQGMEYPVSKISKKPMRLFAQINFDEMPALEPFPEDGLLQFFVDDDCDGFCEGDEGIFIQYIPCAGEYNNPTDLSFLKFDSDVGKKKYESFPIAVPHRIVGKIDEKPPTAEYIELKGLWEDWECSDEVSEKVLDYCKNNEYQIGGYPSSRQWLPDLDDDDVVLLQIGFSKHICFGDAGVIVFFIKDNDLRNLDFSKVWSDFSCG